MKLVRAKIKGLIGVFRGSGIKEIEIDFTKCKSNIIYILGCNGSGKSSLLRVLSPLPDSASLFIEKEECYEELEYDSNGILYKLLIQYPVNRFGDRTTTKAYISKIVDGVTVDLNSNGNVSSYKEVIYNEFKLDSNFMALTSLSLEDRGIVTKTPGERKKYVSSIVGKVEVYNAIHKTLSKRSSVFKSMINNLVAKIESIGSKDNIEYRLDSMNSRIDTLQKQRDQYMKELSKAEALSQQLDTGGRMQSQYTELYTQLQSINKEIETINLFIKNYLKEPYLQYISSQEIASESFIVIGKELIRLETEIDNKKETLQTLLRDKEEDSKVLMIKTNKMESLKSQHNFDDLLKQLKLTRNKITQYKSMLNEMGLTEETTLTKDEFIIALNTLNDIKSQIDVFKSNLYEGEIREIINYLANDISPVSELDDLNNKIDDSNTELSNLKQSISYYTGLLNRGSILLQRPNKCDIDECPFIKDAISAMAENPSEKIDELNIKYTNEYKKYSEMLKKRSSLEQIIIVYRSILNIIRMIDNNRSILNKIPIGNNFTNIDLFLSKLESGDTFNYISDIYHYIDYANLFEEYRMHKEQLVKLESSYEIYKNRSVIVDEIIADIENLNKSLIGMVAKIEDINNDIREKEKELQRIRSLYDIICGVKKEYERLDIISAEKISLETSIRNMASNMKIIEHAIQDINNINSAILNIDNELKPLQTERDALKFSLEKLKEYNGELAIFTAKYNKIEVIKRYSSPTKEGIQTIFVNLYMGQTIKMANELLSMFFNGKLKLLDYVIDSNQFRIPCTSLESSINNDDISSCSGGEKSVIGMILSFALLRQSSTLYDIPRLDEVNSTLDQSNRGIFGEVLRITLDALNIENCLMVSHASESVLDNSDLICLNMEGLIVPKGNIIYQA